jgi:ectoine hydroxylase-related dioxygenase (phytanoyl-CoA dioxygenase family)
VAAAINGDDFVPFNDAIFVKQSGVGGSVSWHQDGVTHWDNPAWDSGIHGFNFQVQLYRSTPANGLWVVPGTCHEGKIDIRARVAANGGSDRLPDAVPLYCEAGDVTIVNRQMLHGSFANTSPDQRISVTFGFHRRSSVLGAPAGLSLKAGERSYAGDVVYDEARIFNRSSVIQVAIDARSQHHPQEHRCVYRPFVGLEDDFRYDDESHERVIKNYNLNDLAI